MTYDVVIIGGGLSGLAASVQLVTHGASVLLVEKAPKLGGRCYSFVDIKTMDVVDNGQHLLIGAYHNLLKYLKIIGSDNLLIKTLPLSLPFFDPMRGRGTFQTSFLPKPYHLISGILKYKLLSFKERRELLKVSSVLNNLKPSIEEKLSTLTIAQWLEELGQSREVKNLFWYPIAISIMNENPEKASALLFARALHNAFLGKKKDSSILFPSVGQSEIYVDPAVDLLRNKKCEIVLNSEVRSIIFSGKKVKSIELKDGRKYEGKNFICTVPPFRLSKILPNEVKTIKPFDSLHKFVMSPIISFHLWFDKDLMDVDFIGLANCKLQWLFDRRKILRDKECTGFISAVISCANDYVNLSKDILLSLALEDINKVYPESRKLQLIHSIIIKEKQATFSATNEIEKYRPQSENYFNNFYLAGDWTNTGLPATIEGAVLSGFKAANTILGR